ncbi:MAG: T9SS type A sorting domain-containing protein, partial [Candidatus Marinimicrobia bacterium]|nr:T9SS type A sorting domain-containing protein [Candidatus Neomarinimicrobiota bacterium]
SIDIYNLLGQKVTRLIDKVMVSGVHTANWDASNVSSGIYFYRLQAGDFVQTRKMLLLK